MSDKQREDRAAMIQRVIAAQQPSARKARRLAQRAARRRNRG